MTRLRAWMVSGCAAAGLAVALGTQVSDAQSRAEGTRYKRLVIRNATLVDGLGTPARGPVDIVVEGDTIAAVVAVDAVSSGRGETDRPIGDHVIDATGKYVLPGFVDMHGHTPEGRVVPGTPLGRSYAYRLWLAHGVTTVRNVGAQPGPATLLADSKSAEQELSAVPDVIPYAGWRGFDVPASGGTWTAPLVRARLEEFKAAGARGIKVFGPTYKDTLLLLGEQTKSLGMGVAIHVGVAEATADVAAKAGVTTIEHWYGIPDSAIPGVQSLPPDYNFMDELARFRYAGQLWRKADPKRLVEVRDRLRAQGVALVPTFVAYEPNRDIMRAQHMSWYDKYAMPAMLKYWQPNPSHHGSYHYEWTTDDEVNWRQNMRLWMDFVRDYRASGGTVAVGSDPGGSFGLFGFTYIRELELYREMGLDPIDIIQAATTTSAAVLGLPRRALGVRAGGQADLLVVNGNPLRDLKVLYGTGVQRLNARGVVETSGGIDYTIRSGIVYDARALLKSVQQMIPALSAQVKQ